VYFVGAVSTAGRLWIYHVSRRRVIDMRRTRRRMMAQTATCEHCGTVIPRERAERFIVEDWTHYFCSERCKLQWGEQGEIEEEE
jgi:hypothetical protein